MKIPKQLQTKNMRFIKLGRQGSKFAKIPIEKKWTSENNYSWENLKLNDNQNYGVATGFDNLLVIDFDDKEFQETVSKILPETFTCRSGGKRLFHMYYRIDKVFTKFPFISTKKQGLTLCDFQCKGGQVVGPGSIHESGKKYDVFKDIPIADITLDTLELVFGPYFKKMLTKAKSVKFPMLMKCSDEYRTYLLNSISISDMLTKLGSDPSKNPCYCPHHGATGAGNLSFDEGSNVYNCFHCLSKGNIFNLWMDNKKVDFKSAMIEIPKAFGLLTRKEYVKNVIIPRLKNIARDVTGKESIVVYSPATVKTGQIKLDEKILTTNSFNDRNIVFFLNDDVFIIKTVLELKNLFKKRPIDFVLEKYKYKNYFFNKLVFELKIIQ